MKFSISSRYCFPRARGDVPPRGQNFGLLKPFSPRTRGCSFFAGAHDAGTLVFPAHAGMFRCMWCVAMRCGCFPRARGDVPPASRPTRAANRFSPRTRGCSALAIRRPNGDIVFPAHAGMFLMTPSRDRRTACFPRARGDVPAVVNAAALSAPFSPRTRGCSALAIRRPNGDIVFPAHAGMFLPSLRPVGGGVGFPRARGDVPSSLDA